MVSLAIDCSSSNPYLAHSARYRSFSYTFLPVMSLPLQIGLGGFRFLDAERLLNQREARGTVQAAILIQHNFYGDRLEEILHAAFIEE